MEKAANKAARLLQIEALLLAYPEGLTQSEIARKLKVNRSTIGRNLSDVPKHIYLDDLDGNKWKIDRDAYLVNVRFNLHEAMAIHNATRLLAKWSNRRNHHAAAALRKLGVSLEKLAPFISEHLITSAEVMDDEAQFFDPVYLNALEMLTRAWSKKRKVRIWHKSERTGKVYQYTLSPYFIEPYPLGQTAHVLGYCEPQNALRTFKLERIKKIEALDKETYHIPDDFSPGELLAGAWGIWYTDAPPQKVVLKFHPNVVNRVQETRWHQNQKTDLLSDGSLQWTAQIAEPREMIPWIRGWGADCKVIEPEKLRKVLMREARKLAELYGVVEMKRLPERYYAHSRDGEDESEWQLLKDHLMKTGDIAFELGEDAGVSELARVAGMLHDLGKYSKEFQARLRGSNRRVDHATAGAKEVMKLFPGNPFAEILSYCIAGHHTGLPDYGSMGDTAGDGTLLARREKKELKNYDAYKTEIDIETLALKPLRLKPARFRIGDKEKSYLDFSYSFLTRMIFSALIDADWLETERYMQGKAKPRGQHADIAALAEEFNRFLQRFDNPQNDLNRKRTETLKHCLAQADSEPGFFTLTVPTGGGKTYASMAFALNHASKHGLKRIICVIPFTGIIEQNAGEFRKSLGDLGQNNILEHHSNFDWDGKRKNKNDKAGNGKRKNTDDETNKVNEKLKLAAENWDIPIVVTTNVQFFESLFASKKKSARKLHNIAKSVIIFDEAQMLPRDYLKPSLLAVQELVQNYGVSTIFCTATQPSMHRFFPKDPKNSENILFTELAPNPQELFDFYRRVQVKNLGIKTDNDIIEQLNARQQALCIVNTRKHAKGLYDQLSEDGSFHLSTLMCPVHRKEKLKKIRQRLINEKPCRVVSTQVMEAGIDVDFPVGYRALAGLDSIIQAAGRVNREGRQASGDMFVFSPKTEFIKRTPKFIEQTAAVGESALRNFADDPTSTEAIEAYYEMLYSLQSGQSFDVKNILGYFDKKTGKPDFDFKKAAENFKLIENNTVSVIIPYDDKAKRLIETLKYTDYPNKTLRKLQTYTVNIYEREFMNLQSKGVIQTIGEQYDVLDETWMDDYYHPETGLLLPASSGGEAIFS